MENQLFIVNHQTPVRPHLSAHLTTAFNKYNLTESQPSNLACYSHEFVPFLKTQSRVIMYVPCYCYFPETFSLYKTHIKTIHRSPFDN